jgi:hypothetical protein
MSITHTIVRSYKDQGSTAISASETPTGNTENNVDVSVVVGTDIAFAWAAVRANLQSLCISSDRALTIETNSSSAPTDTIVLIGGQALVWTLAKDGLSRCPFSASVTSLFFTNASGGTAALKIRALLNQ